MTITDLTTLRPEQVAVTIPAIIAAVRRRLDEATTSGEILEAKQVADAALHVARLRKVSADTQADLLRLIDRAEKIVGQQLIDGRAQKKVATRADGTAIRDDHVDGDDKVVTLKDLGINRDQSSQWQRRARVEDEVVDGSISAALASGRAPTKSDIRRAVRDATKSVGPREQRKPSAETPAEKARRMARRAVEESVRTAVSAGVMHSTIIRAINDGAEGAFWVFAKGVEDDE